MGKRIRLVIQGVDDPARVPGIDAIEGRAEIRCASTLQALEAALPGAEVMLGWNFRAEDLQRAWPRADALRWIHWCGAGVDALLFPALTDSAVVVTNARGVFDRPMAEYALGLVLAMAKGFPRTFAAQRERRWDYRLNERIEGRSALVIGAGSIGRAITRMLLAAGMKTRLMGRTARGGDAEFGAILGIDALDEQLALADYVILITPLTAATRGLMGERQFARMKPSARFVNLGRGALVDERALAGALGESRIAGAASDVFQTEPLPGDSPLWDAPGLIVSPHMSGDVEDCHRLMSEQFLANFDAFERGAALSNVVDKALGFVRD